MQKVTGGDIGFYQDLTRLQTLSGREGLRAAAEGFEAMFLQLVLKSMRSSADALADENSPLQGEQQRFYRDLYDGQLATELASRHELGLAAAIERQLSGSHESLKNVNDAVALQEKQPISDRSALFQQPLWTPVKRDNG
ncbi:MAG: rod-binding protein [Spongiibacteraceae bacterium]|jgi:flagellar protein FlgJ|nr:rod-binding protein [Spongiibacteraceae bacterium]